MLLGKLGQSQVIARPASRRGHPALGGLCARIGLITPPDTVGAATLDDLVAQAVEAESDGFASLWYVQLPMNGSDTLMAIALAGRETSRIELGTGVVPIQPRHPLVMAQQALTAQVACGGRLALGVGLSHALVVEQLMGLSYARPAATMREYLSVLRPLIEGAGLAHAGDLYNVRARLEVPDARRCPILVAALGPAMLRVAGELADGTITWLTGPRTIGEHVAPRIQAAARSAGRPEARVVVSLPLAVTDEVDAAREQVAKSLQMYGALPSYRRMLDMEGAAGPGDVAIVGDEAEVERQLRAFADAGATELAAAVFAVGDDRAGSLDRTRALLRTLAREAARGSASAAP